MDVHSRYQTRVMNLHTRYSIGDDNFAPLTMSGFAISGKMELGFDQSCTFICLRNRKSKPIPVCRSRTNIPKLGKVLRGVKEIGTSRPQDFNTLLYISVFGTVRLNKPQENVGV